MPLLPRSGRATAAVVAALGWLSSLQGCGRSDLDSSLYDDGSDPGGVGGSFGSGAAPTGGKNGNGAGGSRAGSTGRGGSGVGRGGTSSKGGTVSIEGGTESGGNEGGGDAGGGVGGSGVAGSAVGGGAAGAPPEAGVTCGGESCDVGAVCCAGFGGLGCVPSGSDCSGAVLDCTTGGDCPGSQVCCLNLLGVPGSGSVSECRSSCNSAGPGRDRQLCLSDDECPRGRPNCRQTIFGVSICTRR